MNRQVKLVDDPDWTDYGAVGFYEAARRHAESREGVRNGEVLTLQVRDSESEPDGIQEVRVQVRVEFRGVVLNPRNGDL